MSDSFRTLGKAALLDVGHIVGAPPAPAAERDDAERLLRDFDPERFARVTTAVAPEPIE